MNREATEALRRVLGENATRSDYDLRKAVLEASPRMLKPWISRNEAIRVGTLLSIKASIDSGHGETGIFRIGANAWKGFQFDDPTERPEKVQIDLYDTHNHHVEMIFKSRKNANVKVTQADVNLAIETLKASEENGTP